MRASWFNFPFRRRSGDRGPSAHAVATAGEPRAPAAGGIEARVTEALRRVIDPEIGVNIVDLGLVYRIECDPPRVAIEMTMTTPSCPLGDYLTGLARQEIRAAATELTTVEVELVWTPAWSPERMTPAAREALGWDDE
ncbi:MAG: hypothetical protein BroJett029_00410 [Alphaproteobacteria bacterium]|nr:MAG: hypothetical protein BroJett029_00410 [Alphaproteobacteria bacterium]